jgi:Phytanoyl-CoA dioxygenase (PhyH)
MVSFYVSLLPHKYIKSMLATLSNNDIEEFLNNGFIRIENAFDQSLALAGREKIWHEMGKDPNDPSTWSEPVVRVTPFCEEPFNSAANTERLHSAFDQLVGEGAWLARADLGLFLIRFPHKQDAGDTGWHVDGSYSCEDKYFLNVFSKARALLMLFLFSDIGLDDAPTRIRVGSHMDVPPILHSFGEAGIASNDISVAVDKASANRPEVLALGKAGDVYLCHPFLVHAAQKHKGKTPRFMAQPELPSKAPFQLNKADENCSPVELAIRRSLQVAELV